MKKIKVASIFSGGGGLDLGFLQAGYDIIWAIDNNKNAVATYKHNIGEHIHHADINTIALSSIPYCDVVIGGPPCQSFSLAGNRNSDDHRGRLVWKYIEIIKHLKPSAFLFENVTGLTSAKNLDGKKILPQLEDAFKSIGYTISLQVINAADYGVPQIRRRVFIVGLKGKHKYEYPIQTRCPNNYVTVCEALDDLPPASAYETEPLLYKCIEKNDYQRIMRKECHFVTNHVIPQMSELDKYIISHVKPGGNYMDIPENVQSKRIRRLQKEGGHTTCYGRMAPNRPSYTVNTYFNRPNVGCNIHYRENRLITVREALRLQSFPDSYKIISTSKQDRNIIVGNAVPPMVAKALADKLIEYI